MEDEGILIKTNNLIDVKPRYGESKSATNGNLQPSSSSEWMPLCFHSSEFNQRCLVLILICLTNAGFSLCSDNPAALMDHFHKDLSLGTTQFAMLYSFYSFPNIVSCIIGGFLIDNVLGIRLGTILYVILSLIGQVLFATAVFLNHFPTMIVGRFLCGLGCESLNVALKCFTILCFKNQELSKVFGLQSSFWNLLASLSFWLIEPLYSSVNQFYDGPKCLGIVIFIVSSSYVFSFLCSLALGYVDERAGRSLRTNENVETERFKLADIGNMSLIFWMICLIGLCYIVPTFTFVAMAKNFFIKKYSMTPLEAAKTDSIIYVISIFASPIIGIVIDRTGRNIHYILLAIAAAIGAHLIFVFSNLSPYFGMTIMGFSNSVLMGGFSPLIALITPEHQIATAYGISQATLNLGFTVITLLAGVIIDNGGYFWVEIFFMGCLTISFLTTLFVWSIDSRSDRILNMTNGERILRQQIVNRSKSIDPHGERECLIPNSDLQISNQFLSRIDVMSSGDLLKESLDDTKNYGSTSVA